MLTKLAMLFLVPAGLLQSVAAQEAPGAPAPVNLSAEVSLWFNGSPQHIQPVFGPIADGRNLHAYVYLGRTLPRFCLRVTLDSGHVDGVQITRDQCAKAFTLPRVYHVKSNTLQPDDARPALNVTLVSRQRYVEKATLDQTTPILYFFGTVGTPDYAWKEGVYALSVKVDLKTLGLRLAGVGTPPKESGMGLVPAPRQEADAAVLTRYVEFVPFDMNQPADLANLLYFEAENAYRHPSETRLAEARDRYQQIVRLFPGDAPTIERLGEVLLDLGEWDQAAATAELLSKVVAAGHYRRPPGWAPGMELLRLDAFREIAQHRKVLEAMKDADDDNVSQLRRVLAGQALTPKLKFDESAHHALLGVAIATAVRIKAKSLAPTLLRFCTDELPVSIIPSDSERNAGYGHMGRFVPFRQVAWESFVKLTDTPPDRFDPTASKAQRDQMLEPILKVYGDGKH